MTDSELFDVLDLERLELGVMKTAALFCREDAKTQTVKNAKKEPRQFA